MKKKIAAVLLLSTLIAGTVSASSINGDYKGNPIVKITVDGKEVNGEVPAIIYDGTTLIPIRDVSESLGSTVYWDNNTYTASIYSKNFSNSTLRELMAKKNENSKKYNSSNVKYIVTDLGPYISVDTVISDDIVSNLNNIASASELHVDTDAEIVFVNIYYGNSYMGFFSIPTMYAKKIMEYSSIEDYYKKAWTWTPINGFRDPIQFGLSQINTSSVSESNIVESKIDGDFEGFDNGKLFKLQNGQIWEQIDYTYHYSYKYNPKVTIYKDGSNYIMVVDGIEKKVKVQKLK
jgi:hypothetical protein